ncbi:MAG: 3-isopropylmalate dehydratase large subunit [Clostridia bacterium]|nr:3-isopropylmalate dehydratase large subunit [Clostridia bacterium]
MTLTQQILAKKAGKDKVSGGELVTVPVDICLANDITAPVSINVFEKAGFDEVYDKEKIVFVLDHFTPNKDIKSAEQCRRVREFSKKHGIVNLFEGGKAGIEHALLPEIGLVGAGDIVIGADSHTCTYGAVSSFSTGMGSTDLAAAMKQGETWLRVPDAIKVEITGEMRESVSGKDVILYLLGMIGVDGARYMSLEFCGEGIKSLSMDDRFTIANMAVEAGAKNGIFIFDELTEEYLKESGNSHRFEFAEPDDADYKSVVKIDLAEVKEQIAFPNLPSNVFTAEEAAEKEIKIDQVVIGSCTNGRISDLRIAASVMKGKTVKDGVRCIIIPATPKVYSQCIEEGLLKIFTDAGALVSPPTCGPCLGGHMGVLAKGERAVATTNRNFVGRMGDTGSEVYLASPYTAAKAAISGIVGV